MALLYMDGFEHYDSTTFLTKWDALGSGGINGSAGRTGVKCMQNQSSGTATIKIIPVPGDVFIFGFAVKFNTILPAGNVFFQFLESAIVHVAVHLEGSGFMSVKRGTTLLATATTNPLVAANWYYVEAKVVIHDTTGSVEVRVDGTTVTFDVPLTAVDTRNAGTGVVDRVDVRGSLSPYTYYDDLYICDDSGSAPHNDFLGDIKIENLMVQTGNGSNVGLTPSTGTDHGALVDEVPPNTTDYNGGSSVGLKDTYNLPSMVGTGAILGIQTNLYVAKSDAGARSVCPVVRTGGADYDGTSKTLLTTFKYHTHVWEKNPGTLAAWTSADINALEAGMKVTV